MGVANFVRVNLLSLTITMVKTLLVLTTLVACISADVFTASKSFQVKVGKTKKTANCDFTISYTGDTASKSGSKVKCSIAWPKNSPCFSWTFNSNADAVLGLSGGTCRLLAYMEVSSIAAAGVQSGYHKCWNAYLTSTAP